MAAASVHDLASGRRAPRTPLLDTLRAIAADDLEPLALGELVDAQALLHDIARGVERALAHRTETLERRLLTDSEDEELDTEGLMRLGHRSRSWVEHNGHRVAGRHQPGGPGTRVTWSRREALAWFRCQGR